MQRTRSQFTTLAKSAPSGFSLLELLVVLAIFSIVMAVVTTGVTELQKKSSSETAKVDLTQQTRQFMDQIVKDLHHSGYPNPKMFEAVVPATSYGDGLITIRPGYLQFEGDVDGTGTVSEVFVKLVPEAGPCPCSLQRGTRSKAEWLLNGLEPDYYTQVDNIMNSNIFTAIRKDGSAVQLPCTTGGGCADGEHMKNIVSLGLSVRVRTATPDQVDHSYQIVTMTSDAKINNLVTN